MRQVYQTEDELVLYDPEVSGIRKKLHRVVRKVVKSQLSKVASVSRPRSLSTLRGRAGGLHKRFDPVRRAPRFGLHGYPSDLSGGFKSLKKGLKKVVKSKAFKFAAIAAATYFTAGAAGPVVSKFAGKFAGKSGGAFKLAKGAAGAAAKRKGKKKRGRSASEYVMYEGQRQAEYQQPQYAPQVWEPPLPRRDTAAGEEPQPAYAAAGMFGGIPPLALAGAAAVALVLLMRAGGGRG